MSCEHVESYLTHLQNLEWSKSIRAKARQEEARAKKQKSVDDYDWASLLQQGKLGTLTVPELHNYLKHHSLPNKGKTPDKIRCISLHLSAGNAYMGPQDNIQEEDEEEIEEEVVLAEVDSGDDSTDSDLDSESTDKYDSELTDVTMPSTASSTRCVRRARPRVQEEYFFTKSMYVSSKTIL